MLCDMRSAPPIVLSAEEQPVLAAWARGRSVPLRLVERARIVQMAAKGSLNQDIARELEISRPTVQLWRARFLALRLGAWNRTLHVPVGSQASPSARSGPSSRPRCTRSRRR